MSAVELEDLDAVTVTVTVDLFVDAFGVELQEHLNVIYELVEPVLVRLNDPLAITDASVAE